MLQITGDNRTNGVRRSTEHAEKRVIETYEKYYHSKHIPSKRMLVSTVEPCPMCASALVHSLAHGRGGTIIYGASQDDLRGKAVELTTDAIFNEDIGNVEVTKAVKPFRTEPPSYHVEEFIQERNPQIRVVGGYRRNEVLDYMKVIALDHDDK
jgi:tRNA(Arg) A34 adenosine deaminase TadA